MFTAEMSERNGESRLSGENYLCGKNDAENDREQPSLP